MQFFFKQLLFLTLWSSGPVLALGLGDIRIYSYLNDPVDAEIHLLSAGATVPDGLKLRLVGDPNERPDYESYSFPLRSLRFDVVHRKDRPAVIKVTSTHRVREPILAFVLELTAPNVSIQRDYTLLLDPPPYVNNPLAKGARVSEQVKSPPAPKPRSAHKGGDAAAYGPVRNGETLSQIAVRTRPSHDISIYRMTQALFRRNPEAFINGDIDRLRKGARLEVPSLGEIGGRTQTAFKTTTVPVSAARAASTEKKPAQSIPPSPRTSQRKDQKAQDVLRLVSPNTGAQETEVSGPSPQKQRLKKELKEVTQYLSSIREDNQVLRARVAQMELLLGKLRKQALRMVASQKPKSTLASTAPRPKTGSKPRESTKVETLSPESQPLAQTPVLGEWAKSALEWLWWFSLALAVAVVVFALLLMRRKDEVARARQASLTATREMPEISIQLSHDVSDVPTEEVAGIDGAPEEEASEEPEEKNLANLRTEVDTNAAYGRYAAAKQALDQALAIAPSDIELIVKAFELTRLQEDVEGFAAWVNRAGKNVAKRAPAIWESISREGRAWIPDHPVWQQFEETPAAGEDASSALEETRSQASNRR